MLKEVRESNQTLQKQFQDEESCNLKTQLRADDLEKHGEGNQREFAQLKDELAETKMVMDNMISKGLYTRYLNRDYLKMQHRLSLVCFILSLDIFAISPRGFKYRTKWDFLFGTG